jgi:fluoride ion exporter CrcB/FEX
MKRNIDVLCYPIWQTVGVIVGLVGALTVFVSFVMRNPSVGQEKAKLIRVITSISVFICLVVASIIFLH